MNLIKIRERIKDKMIPDYLRAPKLVPVMAYSEDENVFLMDDNTIGVGFHCQPLSGADERIQERMNGLITTEVPADTMLQFILFRSPDISDQMMSMISQREGYRDKLFQEIIKSKKGFFEHYTSEPIRTTCLKGGEYELSQVQDLKSIVIIKMPIKNELPSESESEKITLLATTFKSSLESIGLHPVKMTADSYIRLMSSMLNWDENAAWKNSSMKWEKDKPICEQVFDFNTAIDVSSEGIQLGKKHVKVLSAKKLPESFYFGDAISYVGDLSAAGAAIKSNFMVVTNILLPNPESLKSKIETKRQFTIKQAHGPLLKFVPILADKKNDFDLMYESLKEGAKPVKLSYSIILFNNSAEEVLADSSRCTAMWRDLHFQMMEDKYVALPMFINCLPLCCDKKAVTDLFRYKTVATNHAAVLVPVFGEWKGTGTFDTPLMSRNGQVMSLSVFDSHTNKNFFIAAESGSGKSFLTNELIQSYLSEGAQVWVIDAGKSYKGLCEILNGDFMTFDSNANICINPFSMIDDWEDDEDTVFAIIVAMASEKGSLSEIQTSSLKQIVNEAWMDKGKEVTVDDLSKMCLCSSDQRVKDLGQQMYSFTSQGSYGKYFMGANNIDFTNRFTVLELDELQGRRHLRQVVLLQMISQIQHAMFLGDKGRKKVVVIDEAWDLLKDGEVGAFMESQYRKARKYGGSIGICTQSINDLYANPVGQAIAENSASMFLLGQKAETIDSVKRDGHLCMPPWAFNQLHTVHTVIGAYSEIFIKNHGQMGIGRLVVNEFQKLLFSTSPEDTADIAMYQSQGQGIVEAIHNVLNDRNIAY